MGPIGALLRTRIKAFIFASEIELDYGILYHAHPAGCKRFSMPTAQHSRRLVRRPRKVV
jgi:hypothetical protein